MQEARKPERKPRAMRSDDFNHVSASNLSLADAPSVPLHEPGLSAEDIAEPIGAQIVAETAAADELGDVGALDEHCAIKVEQESMPEGSQIIRSVLESFPALEALILTQREESGTSTGLVADVFREEEQQQQAREEGPQHEQDKESPTFKGEETLQGVQKTFVAANLRLPIDRTAISSADSASKVEALVDAASGDEPAMQSIAPPPLLAQVTSRVIVFNEETDVLGLTPAQRDGNEFFRLIESYQTACTTAAVVSSDTLQALSACEALVNSVWRHIPAAQTVQGRCQDGFPITIVVESTRSEFNQEAFQALCVSLERYRITANNTTASAGYEKLMAKLAIELFLARYFDSADWDFFFESNFADLPAFDCSLHATKVKDLLELLKVLFWFERNRVLQLLLQGKSPVATIDDAHLAGFTADVKRWILHVSTILFHVCDALDSTTVSTNDCMSTASFGARMQLLQHVLRCPGFSSWNGQDLVRFPLRFVDTPQYAWFLCAALSPLVVSGMTDRQDVAISQRSLDEYQRQLAHEVTQQEQIPPDEIGDTDVADSWVMVPSRPSNCSQPHVKDDIYSILLVEEDFASLIERIPSTRDVESTNFVVNKTSLWLNAQCAIHSSLTALVTLCNFPYITRVLAKLCINTLVDAVSHSQPGCSLYVKRAWDAMLQNAHLWAFLGELPVGALDLDDKWEAMCSGLTAVFPHSSCFELERQLARAVCRRESDWSAWLDTPGHAVVLPERHGSVKNRSIGIPKTLARMLLENITHAELLLSACVELCVQQPAQSASGANHLAYVLLEVMTCAGFLMPSCTFTKYPATNENIETLRTGFQVLFRQSRTVNAKRSPVLKCIAPLLTRLCTVVSMHEFDYERHNSRGINDRPIIGYAFSLISTYAGAFGMLAIRFAKVLPLHLWKPDSADVEFVVDSWLACLPAHPHHEVAKFILSRLNYDFTSEDELLADTPVQRLFLDPQIHQTLAFRLSFLYFSHHVHAGVFGYTENQHQFHGWLWSILMSLKHRRLGEPMCASIDQEHPPEMLRAQVDVVKQRAFDRTGSQPDPVAAFICLQFTTLGHQMLTNHNAVQCFRALVDLRFDMPALRVLYDCFPASVEKAGGARGVGAMLTGQSLSPAMNMFVDCIWLLAAQDSRLDSNGAVESLTWKLASQEVANRTGHTKQGVFAAFGKWFSGLSKEQLQVTPAIAQQLNHMCQAQMVELSIFDLELVWLAICVSKQHWWRHRGLCHLADAILRTLHVAPPLYFRQAIKLQWDAMISHSSSRKIRKSASGRTGSLWDDAASSGVRFLPDFPWLTFEILIALDQASSECDHLLQFELGIAEACRIASVRHGATEREVIVAAAKFIDKYVSNFDLNQMSVHRWLQAALDLAPTEPICILYWQQFLYFFLRSVEIRLDTNSFVLFVGSMLGVEFETHADVPSDGLYNRAVRAIERFSARLDVADAVLDFGGVHPSLGPVLMTIATLLRNSLCAAIAEASALAPDSSVHCVQKITSMLARSSTKDSMLDWIRSVMVDHEDMREWRELIPLAVSTETKSLWRGRVDRAESRSDVGGLRRSLQTNAPTQHCPVVPIRPKLLVHEYDLVDDADLTLIIHHIDSDAAFICQASDDFSTRLARHIELDDHFQQILPYLHKNEETTVHRSVECKQRGNRCSGKATFVVRVVETSRIALAHADISKNRAMLATLLTRPLVSMELCIAVLRIRNRVQSLIRTIAERPDTYPNELVRTCCSVFYKLLALRQTPLIKVFPATLSFFTSIVEEAGRAFVTNSPFQQHLLLGSVLRILDESASRDCPIDYDLLDVLIDLWNPTIVRLTSVASETYSDMFKSLMNAFASIQRAKDSQLKLLRLSALINKFELQPWLCEAEINDETEVDWILCVSLNALSSWREDAGENVCAVYKSICQSIVSPICDFFLRRRSTRVLERYCDATKDSMMIPDAWQTLCMCVSAYSLDPVLAQNMSQVLARFLMDSRVHNESLFRKQALLLYAVSIFGIQEAIISAIGREVGVYSVESADSVFDRMRTNIDALYRPWLFPISVDLASPWPPVSEHVDIRDALRKCVRSAMHVWSQQKNRGHAWLFWCSGLFEYLSDSSDVQLITASFDRLFPADLGVCIFLELRNCDFMLSLETSSLQILVSCLDKLARIHDARRLMDVQLDLLDYIDDVFVRLLCKQSDWLGLAAAITVHDPLAQTSIVQCWLQCVSFCCRFPREHLSEHDNSVVRCPHPLVRSAFSAAGEDGIFSRYLRQRACAALTATHLESFLGSIRPEYDEGADEGFELKDRSSLDMQDRLILFLEVFLDFAQQSELNLDKHELGSCILVVCYHAVSQYSSNLCCASLARRCFIFERFLDCAATVIATKKDDAGIISVLCDVFNHETHSATTTEYLLWSFVSCIRQRASSRPVWQAEDEFLALTLLHSVCGRILSMAVMAQLCESAIDWYISLKTSELGPRSCSFNWKPLIENFSAPELAIDDFLFDGGCVENGCVLTFYINCLQQIDSNQMAVVRAQAQRYIERLRIHVIASLKHEFARGDDDGFLDMEMKMMLVWQKVVEIYWFMSCGKGATSAASDFIRLAELLNSWGGDKLPSAPGTVTLSGLLATIGITRFSDDSPFSNSFKVACKLFASFLLCQITPNGREVRLSVESPLGPPKVRRLGLIVSSTFSPEFADGAPAETRDVIRDVQIFSTDPGHTLSSFPELLVVLYQALYPKLLLFMENLSMA